MSGTVLDVSGKQQSIRQNLGLWELKVLCGETGNQKLTSEILLEASDRCHTQRTKHGFGHHPCAQAMLIFSVLGQS